MKKGIKTEKSEKESNSSKALNIGSCKIQKYIYDIRIELIYKKMNSNGCIRNPLGLPYFPCGPYISREPYRPYPPPLGPIFY